MTDNEFITRYIKDNINESTSKIAKDLYRTRPELFGNLGKESRRKKISRIRHLKKLFSSPEEERADITRYSERGDYAEIVKVTSERIRTLDDLVRICEVDTSIWEVDRYEVNSYESHTKLRHFAEGERTDDEHKVVPLFQVKAFLKRNKHLIIGRDVQQEILQEIQNISPLVLKIKHEKITNPHLLEINIFDLHLGKHAWGKETGEDYDLKIASELFMDCLSDLITHGVHYGIDRILFPVGNDFFNVDNRFNQTSNGTPQSEDTRWQKTFRVGRKLIMEGVTSLSKYAPVDIIVIPGNHDFERTFYLGEVLAAVYYKDANINVDNSPNPRKYYHYGSNLIGFTHGKDEKIPELPLIMASEVPELWSQTQYREWHLGHIHHKKEMKWISVEEHKGAVVRFMRSLTPPDGWHHMKGYTGSTRAGEAFIWNKLEGLVGQFSANI